MHALKLMKKCSVVILALAAVYTNYFCLLTAIMIFNLMILPSVTFIYTVFRLAAEDKFNDYRR